MHLTRQNAKFIAKAQHKKQPVFDNGN